MDRVQGFARHGTPVPVLRGVQGSFPCFRGSVGKRGKGFKGDRFL